MKWHFISTFLQCFWGSISCPDFWQPVEWGAGWLEEVEVGPSFWAVKEPEALKPWDPQFWWQPTWFAVLELETSKPWEPGLLRSPELGSSGFPAAPASRLLGKWAGELAVNQDSVGISWKSLLQNILILMNCYLSMEKIPSENFQLYWCPSGESMSRLITSPLNQLDL